MKKQIAIVFLCSVMMLSLASATYANYFYRDDCSHCQSIKPFMLDLNKQFDIKWFDVYQGSYNVDGTPTMDIVTSDKRTIRLVGSYEIPAYSKCELKERSSMDCVTRSALDGVDPNTNSLFVR